MSELHYPEKKIKRLQFFVTGATIFTGWLAGATLDRFVVQFPAWRFLGVAAWADYSRHADMGNGFFLYPFEAIGGFLFLAAASLTVLKNRSTLKDKGAPVYLAAILAALGLFFTAFAAPVMLSIKNPATDTILLQQAFDKFYFWSLFRAIVQVSSFFVCLWAMAKVFSKKPEN